MIFNLFAKQKKARRHVAVGRLGPYDRQKVEERWERIEQLIQVGKPSAVKEAVIVADKLLDYALKKVSSGEAMGERLKNARDAFPPSVYQGLWDAHKSRNALVHDSDYDLAQVVARSVLGKFKAGFKALGVRL